MSISTDIRALHLTSRDSKGRFASVRLATVTDPTGLYPPYLEFSAGDRIVRRMSPSCAILHWRTWTAKGIRHIEPSIGVSKS